MKPTTQQWIDKAEDDWRVAQKVYRARKDPSYDAACFHTQQCAEKYLKAILNEAGQFFAKTHNLIDLHTQCLKLAQSWSVLFVDLSVLNFFSVDYRYPGKSATKSQAKDAIKSCRAIRALIRQSFNLPV